MTVKLNPDQHALKRLVNEEVRLLTRRQEFADRLAETDARILEIQDEANAIRLRLATPKTIEQVRAVNAEQKSATRALLVKEYEDAVISHQRMQDEPARRLVEQRKAAIVSFDTTNLTSNTDGSTTS